MLTAALLATALPWITSATAQAPFDGTVKVGILTDQSSLYADVAGPGMLASARLALDDYKAANPSSKLKIESLMADHQSKSDLDAAIARQWFDQGVDMIDAGTSSVALAVAAVARDKNKVYFNTSAGTARLTGDACSPNTVHWTWDNYARSYAEESKSRWDLVKVAAGLDGEKSVRSLAEGGCAFVAKK